MSKLHVQALILLEGMCKASQGPSNAGRQVSPDVVSYNTAIKACINAHRLDLGIEVTSLPALKSI